MPMAVLVAVLYAFSRLAAENEITAMKAGGLSLYRVSLPVVGTTVLLSVFSFGIEGYVMPFSNQRASQIRDEIRGRSSRSTLQPQRRWVLGSGAPSSARSASRRERVNWGCRSPD